MCSINADSVEIDEEMLIGWLGSPADTTLGKAEAVVLDVVEGIATVTWWRPLGSGQGRLKRIICVKLFHVLSKHLLT